MNRSQVLNSLMRLDKTWLLFCVVSRTFCFTCETTKTETFLNYISNILGNVFWTMYSKDGFFTPLTIRLYSIRVLYWLAQCSCFVLQSYCDVLRLIKCLVRFDFLYYTVKEHMARFCTRVSRVLTKMAGELAPPSVWPLPIQRENLFA